MRPSAWSQVSDQAMLGGMAVGGWVGGRIGEDRKLVVADGGSGPPGPSGSGPASPVSRAEIGECGCLGIGQW